MGLDKNLYREAFKVYQQWNDIKATIRIHQVKKLTPQQAWNQYQMLWELLVEIAPEVSSYQHQEHIFSLVQYLLKVQKLGTTNNSRGEET
jgi:hypothetical protein